MNRWSIRVRLTLWYLAVLGPATLALAAGSWWLARHSVMGAVDETIAARLDGTRTFLADMDRAGLSHADMTEEFGEYVELSHGDGLLDVVTSSGEVFSRPAVTGWSALVSETPPVSAPADRDLGGEPYRVASSTFRAGPNEYRAIVAVPTRAARDALRRFAWILAAFAPLLLAGAGWGGWWIAARALAPVDRMTRAVQETTLRSLDRRLEVPPADDELRRLAETFNEMLGRMQAGVADLTRLTAEASHELRTPVSLVRTSVDVALAQPRSAEEYRDALREILGHAEQMSALVTDLLTLARADAGVEAGDAAPVDLSALARDVGHQFERSGAIRGVSCEVAVDADVVVLGDESSLRRLVTILMDNAVKYTPATGRITLAVSRAGDSSGPLAVIEVTDTGIGVDPADRSRVFDRFYRGAQARQMAADGSGLGLPIARAIVERAHGTIALDSGPGGGGCRVTVRLPVDRRLEEPHALHGTRDLAPDVASADAPRAGHAGA